MNPKRQEATLKKYVCTICGYVYDPAEGDPDNEVADAFGETGEVVVGCVESSP